MRSEPIGDIRRNRKPMDPVAKDGILDHELARMSKELGLIPNQDHVDGVVELQIDRLLSTGHGAGAVGQRMVVVPFTVPGDFVKAELGRVHDHYIEGKVIEVLNAGAIRDDTKISCKHFGHCSGCQLQMVPYENQLEFKTQVVHNAYRQFGFDTDTLPIHSTVPSPLEYNYRTKLTPHFGPKRDAIKLGFEGMNRRLFDLDRCEIATEILNKGLKDDRLVLESIVRRYKKAGTVLLRDKSVNGVEGYTTNHREVVTQQIGDYKFQFPAGEFFQNNNSILPLLLDHIGEFIEPQRHKNLVDTYCGSGFFGISLSKDIDQLVGIEISKGSLQYAKSNADLNGLKNAEFLLGSSEEIFKGLDRLRPEETVVILDPSRKGSNEDYLSQLSHFRPSVIIYVSCNVHSQARDLQYFFNETVNGAQYETATIRGYDFFPQTKHVESLAVLRLKL